MKMQKKKSNYVVWPVASSKFLKMARGPKSLATPDLNKRFLHELLKPIYAVRWDDCHLSH